MGPTDRLTILLSGMIAADPRQGGATWAVLQYALGLARLGHDVFLVEPLPRKSLQPAAEPLGSSANARYFREVVGTFGLAQRTALLLAGTTETVGLSYPELREAARRADLLINISGMLADETLLESIPSRVYLDLDPAFVQLWHTVQGIDMRFDAHTHFATIGLAIGSPECRVPTDGRRWMTTLQPVVLDRWPAGDAITWDAFTTIGSWRGYGSIEHEGLFHGQRAHSLRRIIQLPQHTREELVLALNIHPDEEADLAALRSGGWRLVDPYQVAGTPDDYQEFIRGSRAELGVAKSGYVESRCGWFSDRSLCYLASGRPVLAQETGFSRFLPAGAGLLVWETVEDVLAGIHTLRSDYPSHARAAREIAQEYFDSDRVLVRLLEHAGARA